MRSVAIVNVSRAFADNTANQSASLAAHIYKLIFDFKPKIVQPYCSLSDADTAYAGFTASYVKLNTSTFCGGDYRNQIFKHINNININIFFFKVFI